MGSAGIDPDAALQPEGQVIAAGRRRWAGCSSSSGTILLALADAPVSADIEQVRSLACRTTLAERYLAAPGPDAALDDRAFWAAWTRKEAVLKLLRCGLRCDPARVELEAAGAEGGARLDGRRLLLSWHDLSSGEHAAAIAVWTRRNDGYDLH